ncbi:MAG TPA: hypothetical protein VII74_07475 [Chthoniobacterales bacterium]
MQNKLLVAAFFGILACGGSGMGQDIRRALPVYPPQPTVAPQIRRAVPVYPLATPPPSANPLPTASVNDTAHFLAGLPIPETSPLFPATRNPEWQRHAAFFNQMWTRLSATQFSGIRNWEASYLPEANAALPVAFYLFSGPDFLYAHQFFPHASTYILAGTEPIGPLPDVSRLTTATLGPALDNFEKALNSVLSFSFFITKDMKTDLQRDELRGTLPIFYVFLARAGKTITDVTFVALDKNGNPQISSANSKGLIPGVRLTFTGPPDNQPQTLYYFTTDLSDDGIHTHPGFMKFCSQQGLGYSLLKSASYLMFEPGFAAVRNFLLTHSKALIQDDSGIPVADFNPTQWNLRFFGAYDGPIDIFKQHYQPQLAALYRSSHPPLLPFGIGYRWQRSQSTLLLAIHK